MADSTGRQFTPDYAVLPGDTVLEVLESVGITQAELAERTGRPKKTISEIINGKAAITPETALQFERVLGPSASYWGALEQNYRTALARGAERARLEEQKQWLTQLPVRALINAGWVAERVEPADQVEAMLSYFGVASTEAWRSIWSDWTTAAAFRKAPSFDSDFGTVAAWLRRGELEARSIRSAPYSVQAFKTILHEIRALTREAPGVFVNVMVERCAAAGVAVCFLRELPKLRVCGATRWLTPEKALIQLSLRYHSDDHLWFTFFHEAAHILLHGKRAVFVESHAASAKSSLIDTVRRRVEEDEANRFAGDLLIPSTEYSALLKARTFSAAAIKAFADHIGIAPGIVLGRLQHDHVIPYKTPLNTLKRYFDWAEN